MAARRPLSARQSAARERALHAIADLRSGRASSLSLAAREKKTTVRSIRKYTPSAIRRPEGERRWQARPGDTYASTMQVLTVNDIRTMRIQGSKQRQTVGRHWSAVRRFIEYGDDSDITRFAGVSVAGYDLITNLDDIATMAGRGELDDIDVYVLSLT